MKRNAPLDVVSDTFTIDDLHRLYGHGDYFCQAYTLSATRGLQTPLGSKTWHVLPCEFDDSDDNDPEEEEDDVGTAPWPNMDVFKESEPTLRKEMRRRATIRRELAEDDGQGRGRDRFDDGDDEGEGQQRGFRDRDRGVRGRGGPMGGMRRPMEEPDWMFDPNTRPTAPCPPGFMWAFGGNPMKWYHTEKTAEAVAAAVVPVVAPERTPFLETQAGVAMITGALSALGVIVTKALEKGPPPPDPMAALATLMAAMNGNKGDPKELKQLEIEAEEKRARLAMEAETARIERETARIAAAAEAAEKQRRHEAEVAAAQRAHDAKLEAERREAAAAAAIAAEERAKQRAIEARNDLIALERMGLTGNKGPTPEQVEANVRARMEVENMRERLAALAAQKTPDAVAQLEAAKKLITSLGGKVGGDDDPGGPLALLLNSEAGAAMGSTLITRLAPMLERLLSPSAPAAPAPTPAPDTAPIHTQVSVAPTQAQIDEYVRRQQDAAYRKGLEDAARAAQIAPQPQPQPQPQPSILDWQPVAAQPPAEPPAAAQPAPTPEPVVEESAPPVEEQPATEPDAPTQEPAAPVDEPEAEPPAEPVAEPAPAEPEAPTEVTGSTGQPIEAPAPPAEPDAA